jgi:glucose 1-dehydrogenase
LVALVSGGAGDIGAAIAARLRREGWSVSTGDIAPGADVMVDTADSAQVAAWLDACEPFDAVVVNAGIVQPASALETPVETWQETMRVNLEGAFLLSQAATRRWRDHARPGRLVFLGSWVADRPDPGIAAYSVSKAALRMWMRCLALETAPLGIRVNEVAPGYVDAGLSGRMFAADPTLRARCELVTPLRELISADAVADAVAYLLGPGGDLLTGTTITLDAGRSLVS